MHKWIPRRLSQLRLSAAPVALVLFSTILFLFSFFLPGMAYWQGFLLAIPFMVATTGLGWQAGALLIPFGLGLVYLRSGITGTPAMWHDYGGILLAMALGALTGQQIFALWRLSEKRARSSERRAKLLQQAAIELNQASSIDELYRNAPRLLADLLPFTHAEIFVPEADGLRVHTTWRWKVQPDFWIPLKTVCGRALITGELQYVRDATQDSDYMVAPGAEPTLSELALPIHSGNTVKAVLNLEHDMADAFGEDVQASLRAFVRMVEEVLERLNTTSELADSKAEQEVLAVLSQRLLLTEGVSEAVTGALEVLLTQLDVDRGAIMTLNHGQFTALAVRGAVSEERLRVLRSGLPYVGEMASTWESRQPLFLDSFTEPVWSGATDARSVAVVPIVDASSQVTALLALTRTGTERPWTDSQRRTLNSAAISLAAALERAVLNRQLIAMLAVIRQLRSSEAPDVLYRRAAEAVVDLVPGAEAASILVRQGNLYYYEAAVGWNLEELQTAAGPFTYEDQLTWYAGSTTDFEAGTARVLKGSAIAEHSSAATHSPAHISGGGVQAMKSQVMVPITDMNGQIVAILNLDNFSTEDAFSAGALRLAESFAQHIAVLVGQAEQVVELERSAVTDPLTGIGNREGFERAFRQELARARRYEYHLNLVMLDLNRFKEVNDRFGHSAGDAALKRVAQILDESKREADSVFRWGGDEFVMLLPEVRPEAAKAAMQRLIDSVAAIDVQGTKLGVSGGVASYPTDGLDPSALLDAADARMYARKPEAIRAKVPRIPISRRERLL